MMDVSDAEIEAGGQALRERNMAGRITRPWDRLPKSDKRKWLDMARDTLVAARRVAVFEQEDMIAAAKQAADIYEAEITRLRETLEWLNSRGGLGLDVHERIRAALTAGDRK